MRDELLSKIGKALEAGINEEKDLVYLLVEIRKLMERRPKYQDAIINSFSNWVVHPELSQPRSGTTEVLKEFDDIVTIFKEKSSSKRYFWHFNFEGLRKQLRELLKYFGKQHPLPLGLTDDEDQWMTFVFLYASIVGDCPIIYTASQAGLKYLKQLELEGHPEIPDLKWKATLKDGETSHFSVGGGSFDPPLRKPSP